MIKYLKVKIINLILLFIYLSVSYWILINYFKFVFDSNSTITALDVNIQYLSRIYFILMISFHSFYAILYNLPPKWLKKYKSNSLGFPWEENKKQWRKDLPEILFIYVNLIRF